MSGAIARRREDSLMEVDDCGARCSESMWRESAPYEPAKCAVDGSALNRDRKTGEDVVASVNLDSVKAIAASRQPRSSLSSDTSTGYRHDSLSGDPHVSVHHGRCEHFQHTGSTHCFDDEARRAAFGSHQAALPCTGRRSADHAHAVAAAAAAPGPPFASQLTAVDRNTPSHHEGSKEDDVEDATSSLSWPAEGNKRSSFEVSTLRQAPVRDVGALTTHQRATVVNTRLQRHWQAICEESIGLPKPMYKGTHIPAGGWLNACRLCGSWTSSTQRLPERGIDIPMCAHCCERLVQGTIFDIFPIGENAPPPITVSPIAGISGAVPAESIWSTPRGQPWVSHTAAASGGPFQTVQFVQDQMRRNGADIEAALFQLHLRVSSLLGHE